MITTFVVVLRLESGTLVIYCDSGAAIGGAPVAYGQNVAIAVVGQFVEAY